VGIAGGVGMLHFYDLVHYLLRMNANRIGKIKKREYKIFKDETFDALSDPLFKFILFSSYKLAAVPGVLVQKTCDKWSKQYNFNNFELHQRIGETGAPYWDENFIKERIPSNVKKIMLAGSTTFISNIRKILKNCGFNEKIIVEL
jgi:NAD(P)H-flavin reductase